MAIPILAYHAVSNVIGAGIARTTISQFRKQMTWLSQNGFSTITLHEYFTRHQNQLPVGAKSIIISFDDSYECLDAAAKIMSEFNFVGCCFVISDYVGKTNAWDYQFLNHRAMHADYSLLEKLLETGWEVGSHTKTHAFLPDLSISEVEHELYVSKAVLEKNLGIQIRSLSYPFGKCNESVIAVAKEAGYVLGVNLGMQPQSTINFMKLPRIGIYLFDFLPAFSKKIKLACQDSDIFLHFQRYISMFSYGSVVFNKIKTKLSA
ncbi:MAG: polysaccharide deacetylase family protein [Calditrichaeota bacterium]|nr:MAG: polysaccharide deacetylase family protein [Calditrichota bacterium]